MLKNYIKIAIRNILRNRMFSFINIFGLSISLSISMILIMMVADQMSYDWYNSKKERIFRINTQRLSEDDFVTKFATAPLPLATALLDNYPEIKNAVRIRRGFGNDWITSRNQLNIHIYQVIPIYRESLNF